MPDILLEIGINLQSLKAAKTKIEAELKTWKTPSTGVIDEKAIRGATRAAKSYLKEVGDAGKKIVSPESAVRASEAFKKIEAEAGASENQLAKLAQTTAYYKSKNDIMGTSLSSVSSELSAYLKVEAQGIVLDETSAKRKQELILLHQKLAKTQQGLMHGINLPRLLLWAVGWTLLYRAMNIVGQVIGDMIQTIMQLNEAIDRARIVHGETAKVFDRTYGEVRRSIYATAEGSRVAAKDIAKAFQTLTYEGTSLKTSLEALTHVRDLMVITGEQEKPVATALIETYGLFKDKISDATGESEKLAKITDLLTAIFTKAHITIAEYQQIMSYIAPTAAEAVESFEFLARLLIFADEQMLQGRRAAMALMEALVGLVDNSAKLAEVLGIVFRPGEDITVEEVLRRISATVKDLNEQARKDLLGKIFKGSALRLVLELLKQSDLTLSSVTKDVDGLGKAMSTAADRSRFLGIAFKTQFEKIGSAIASAWEKFNGFMYDVDRKTEQYEIKQALASSKRKKIFGIQPGVSYPERLIEAGRRQEEQFKKYGVGFTVAPRKEDFKSIEEFHKALDDFSKVKLPEIKPRIFTQEEIKNSITITQETKKQLAIIQREADLRVLEASEVSATYLQQQKIVSAVEKATALIKDEEARRAAIADLMRNTSADVETLYKTAMSHVNDEKVAQEYINEIIEARYEIYQRIAEEVKDLADKLEGVAVDFVKKLTTGTLDIKGFLSGIMDAYKTALAENIVKIFGEKTGIFSNMATAFMNPIQKAHYSGIKDAVPQIIKAHIDGIKQGMSDVSATTEGQQQSSSGGFMQSIMGMFGGGGGGGGADGGLMSLFGGKKTPTAQTATVAPMAAAGGSTQVPVKPSGGGMSMSQMSQAAGSIMSVASFVNDMAGAYKAKGSGNPWGTAMNLGVSGAIAGAAVGGPIGAVIGATVGTVYGFIRGAQSKTTTETQQQTVEITSAIKVSNKELQLVNRNLEGIRRGFEGYWMRTSAYFSERPGVEERFNLDRQRGILVS